MTDAPSISRKTAGVKPSAGAPDAPKADERVVIKKYANRRLYNTRSSTYVTLDHLSEMVKEGVDFVVFDAKSNDDITRQVLTQIIFDEESRGENLLPIQFLRQLIRFYGASMQSFVPSYLEMSLDAFTKQHETTGGQWGKMFSGAAPTYPAFEEQVRQNMALFDRAMKMFTPFSYPLATDAAAPPPQPAPTSTAPTSAAQVSPAKAQDPSADSLAELKRRIEEMQQQIEKLAVKQG